jgi:hypothetical protein
MTIQGGTRFSSPETARIGMARPSHDGFLEERGMIRVQSMQGADRTRKLRGLRG